MASTPPINISVFDPPAGTSALTPHHSQATTPTSIPINTLSLHEYRKQQRSPDILQYTNGPSLKRKPGTPQLNPDRPPSNPRPMFVTVIQHHAKQNAVPYEREQKLRKKAGQGQLKKAPSRLGERLPHAPIIPEFEHLAPSRYHTPNISHLPSERPLRDIGDSRFNTIPMPDLSPSISSLSFRTAEPYANLSTQNIASSQDPFSSTADFDKENVPTMESNLYTTFADHTRSVPSSSFHIHEHFPPLPSQSAPGNTRSFANPISRGDPQAENRERYVPYSDVDLFASPSFAPCTLSGLAQSVGANALQPAFAFADRERPLNQQPSLDERREFLQLPRRLNYQNGHPRHSPFSYNGVDGDKSNPRTSYQLKVPDTGDNSSFVFPPTERDQHSPTPQKQTHARKPSGSLEHVLRHRRDLSDRYPILQPIKPKIVDIKPQSPKSRLAPILPPVEAMPRGPKSPAATTRIDASKPEFSRSQPNLTQDSSFLSVSPIPRTRSAQALKPYDGPLQSRFSDFRTSSASGDEDFRWPDPPAYSLSSYLASSSTKSTSPKSGWTSHGRFDSHQSTTIQGDFDSFYGLYARSSRQTSASFHSRKRLPRPDDARTTSSISSSRPSIVQVHYDGVSFDLLNPHNSLDVSVFKDESDDEIAEDDLGKQKRAQAKGQPVIDETGSVKPPIPPKSPSRQASTAAASKAPLDRATTAERNALKDFKFPSSPFPLPSDTTSTNADAFHDTSSILDRYAGPSVPLPPIPARFRIERTLTTPLTLPGPTDISSPSASYGDTRDLLNVSAALLKPLSKSSLRIQPPPSLHRTHDPEKQAFGAGEEFDEVELTAPAPVAKPGKRSVQSPFREWVASATRKEDKVGWRRFSVEAQLRVDGRERGRGQKEWIVRAGECVGRGWIIFVVVCLVGAVGIGVGVGVWRALAGICILRHMIPHAKRVLAVTWIRVKEEKERERETEGYRFKYSQ
ncbi:hypothetical protein EJ05DRAFT_485881 [Pseudovirgaria hyperparasitica]|uniref:Uncharacterized protein n=1 Tax=Pseudovirgaria hyperparasitica TaxID=470096 RepID=A0A6A6W9D5_9PEZI|nr:uncharacterized protein EJ05DRAFT_485881 [Pseudovirgaria hyperparasitica]KAF2758799.1 hypothetical protein EJ05DRAFT_485881 [Pseudovirgaria hyperparasitica]